LPSYWLCRLCRTRNIRTASRKCQACGKATKPKKRTPKHAETLRDDSYAVYVHAARDIHGVSDESCCVCGKPRTQDRRHDRDHGHLKGSADYGRPRGLACGGNRGCNVLMLPWVTADTAAGIYAAKKGAGEPDAHRWHLIAQYLHRVQAYYQREGETGDVSV